MQQYADIYLLQSHCTCFGCHNTHNRHEGSILDRVIDIYQWRNPSSRTMSLGSTKTLTEMSTKNISRGLRGPVLRVDKFTTFLCRLSRNSRSLKPLKP